MFSVEVDAKSNKKAFEQQTRSNIDIALNEIGLAGLRDIDSVTPRDTGFMALNNKYTVQGNETIFSNNTEYVVYHIFGTTRIKPNNFFLRGINNARSAFRAIIKNRLGV